VAISPDPIPHGAKDSSVDQSDFSYLRTAESAPSLLVSRPAGTDPNPNPAAGTNPDPAEGLMGLYHQGAWTVAYMAYMVQAGGWNLVQYQAAVANNHSRQESYREYPCSG
jgi:hypothetical protein